MSQTHGGEGQSAGTASGWLTSERRLVALGAVVGVVTALGAWGFSALIEAAEWLFFAVLAGAANDAGVYIWILPLLPMSGALLVGLITAYFAPEAEGHGVPEVMDAMARKGGRIRPRVAAAKAVASALTIGSGGSAGTEGPIIQIGAALGSGAGQRLGVTLADIRVLIGCGAAAGIAAIFNAPIAGVLFAVEVLLRDVSLRSFVPIIVAAVGSSTITQALSGHNQAIFPAPVGLIGGEPLYAFTVGELPNYLLIGVICGLVALTFIKVLYFSEDAFRRLPVHRVARPVVGAALLGLVALGSEWVTSSGRPDLADGRAPDAERVLATGKQAAEKPAIMGNGYPVITQALTPTAYRPVEPDAGRWTVWALLALLAAKAAATCLTLGSGGSGGVFAPSLFLGAAVGGAFGLAITNVPLFADANPGAYALIGMAAVVASSIHAPLTATLMLFELTRDYEVIVPIMLASVVGLAVCRFVEPASIYTLKLLRRGVDLHAGQDVSLLKHVSVREQMRTQPATVAANASPVELVAAFVEHPGDSLFVVGDKQRLLGVVTHQNSRSLLANANAYEDLLTARDVMLESGFPTIAPTDNLADAMRRLANYRGEVAVVEDGRLVGAIWPEDVIARYNGELFKRDMASGMASAARDVRSGPTRLTDDVSLVETPVPASFVGRSLAELDLRQRYAATVLLIKQHTGLTPGGVNSSPRPDYIFQTGDVVLVMAPDEQLERLRHGA